MIKNFEENRNQGSDQVSNFVANTSHIPAPAAVLAGDGKLAPRVPFPTAYELTYDQEAAMIDWADQRRIEMESEMGRVATGDVNWYQAAASAGVIPGTATWKTHFGKRYVYDLAYHNEIEWRTFLLGGLFTDSNFTIPIARRICNQMIARANNYFFATDPWCSAFPVGNNDKDLSVKLDRYQQHKFSKNGLKHVLEQANKLAFVRGESVVKTNYDITEQIFKQVATVLVDDKGDDIVGADKDYILNTDIWVPVMQMTPDPATGQPMVDPSTGQPLPPVPSDTQYVLKRDLITPKPAVLNFVTKKVTRKKSIFKGAKSEVVYYRDFLCPLTAASVQDADIVIHEYDMTVMKLIDLYNRKAMIGQNADEELETTRKAIELIRTLASSDGQPKSAKDQPRLELDENTAKESQNTGNPVFAICECHMRYDADGDGIMEDVVLVYAKESKVPIFYDYVANTTPDGERPYDVIRINEIDGRWYGLGAMEMFERHQEAIDLFFNRWNFAQSRAGRVDFWNPENTVEGNSNKNLQMNWGNTYTKKPGKFAKDILESVQMSDDKGDVLEKLMEFMIQIATNESGVSNANDAAAAGLDTSELATGVRNIEKSGQELFAPFLSTLEPGHTGVCRRNMNFNFMYMDDDDVYVFFEGDQQSADLLRREEVSDLEMDIDLLLTRYRGEQLLQSNGQAMQICQIYYSFPYEVQVNLQQLAIDQLRALQIQNPENLIKPTQIAAPMPGQAGSGGNPAQPPPQPPMGTPPPAGAPMSAPGAIQASSAAAMG